MRAGVLAATTGPRGGFRLARPADEVTLLDVVEAVAGTSPPYECREIRQQGTGALPARDCRSTCILAQLMDDAHQAWRRHLRGTSLADVVGTLPPTAPARTRRLVAATPRSPA